MSLEDLTEHIPAQRDAVNKLWENPRNLLHDHQSLPTWNRFNESVWGRSLRSLQEEKEVERDDDPIGDTHILLDSLPRAHSILIPPKTPARDWNVYSRQILVRSERAALSASEEGMYVFVVTGQPGNGLPPSFSVTYRIQHLIRKIRLFALASHTSSCF